MKENIQGVPIKEEEEVIEEPIPEIDFSQVVPQVDAAPVSNNVGNVGNIDLNFLAGSPKYVTSNDITYQGSKPSTVSFLIIQMTKQLN